MNLIKNIAYKTLDVVTGGSGMERSVGAERVRFPVRWSRYYQSDYEPETFKFFRDHVNAGDTVLDIGGHIGLFAVVAARLVGPAGRVITFEPTPFTRSVLEEVVRLNGCGDIVEIRPEAVSSEKGTATFFDTGDVISNANSLVQTDRSRFGIDVSLITVDEFAAENNLTVNCMKIDVEGAELDALRGARETLQRVRPVVRLSLHPPFIKAAGQSLNEIWDLLDECSMHVFDGTEQVEKDAFCARTGLFDVNVLPA